MKKIIMLSVLVVLCLSMLSGCTGTSHISEIILSITVIGTTEYSATLDVALRNDSRQTFYPTRVTIKWCDIAGSCRTEQVAPYHWTESIPAGVTRSEIETIPIVFPGFNRLEWLEMIVEGRFASGKHTSASSGRVNL